MEGSFSWLGFIIGMVYLVRSILENTSIKVFVTYLFQFSTIFKDFGKLSVSMNKFHLFFYLCFPNKTNPHVYSVPEIWNISSPTHCETRQDKTNATHESNQNQCPYFYFLR